MDGTTHDLLLALAGRVDDDLLATARELVAVGEDAHAVELLTASLVADRAVLPEPVRTGLVDAALATRAGLDTAGLPPADRDPADGTPHRFDAGPADDDLLTAALLALPARQLRGCRVLRTRRLTPAGSAPGPLPHPVVLVEVQPDARPTDVLAYQLAVALDRAGLRASVEVLTAGAPVSAYHAAALAAARPVRSDGDGEQFVLPTRTPGDAGEVPLPGRRRAAEVATGPDPVVDLFGGGPTEATAEPAAASTVAPIAAPIAAQAATAPPAAPPAPVDAPAVTAPAAEPRPAAVLAPGLDGQASTEPESPAAQTSTTQPPATQPPVDELPRRGALAALRPRAVEPADEATTPADLPRRGTAAFPRTTLPDPIPFGGRTGPAPVTRPLAAVDGPAPVVDADPAPSAATPPRGIPADALSGPLDRPLLDPLLDPTVRDPDPLGTSDPATDPATSLTVDDIWSSEWLSGEWAMPAGGLDAAPARPTGTADRDRPAFADDTRRPAPDADIDLFAEVARPAPRPVPRGPLRRHRYADEGAGDPATQPQDEAVERGPAEDGGPAIRPAAVTDPALTDPAVTDPGVTDPAAIGLAAIDPTAADPVGPRPIPRPQPVAAPEPTVRRDPDRAPRPSPVPKPPAPEVPAAQMQPAEVPRAEIPSAAAQDDGLGLKPESLARLSDADRQLLARLQAELRESGRPADRAGAHGAGPNGTGAFSAAPRSNGKTNGSGPHRHLDPPDLAD